MGVVSVRRRTKTVAVAVVALVVVGILLITPMLAIGNGVPTMYPSVPKSKSTADHAVPLVVWGTLWPKVKAGTYPVKILCYRKEKQANGTYKYVYRKYGWAKAYTMSAYETKYRRSMTLSKGKWRLRAFAKAQTIGGKYYRAHYSDGYKYVTMY